MDNDSFVFYRSFYEALQNVPKKHRTEVYEAVFAYAFEAREPSLTGVTRALWELIRPQLDASRKRYENAKKGAEHGEKGAKYGHLGGRPKKTEEPEKKPPLRGNDQNPLNVNVNSNVNVNDNVNVNVNAPDGVQTTTTESETRTTIGVWPTIGKIKEYCAEQGIETDVSKFYQYNLKRKFDRDWKEALTLWVGHDRQDPEPKKKPNKFNDNFPARQYDYDELEKRLLQVKGT